MTAADTKCRRAPDAVADEPDAAWMNAQPRGHCVSGPPDGGLTPGRLDRDEVAKTHAGHDPGQIEASVSRIGEPHEQGIVVARLVALRHEDGHALRPVGDRGSRWAADRHGRRLPTSRTLVRLSATHESHLAEVGDPLKTAPGQPGPGRCGVCIATLDPGQRQRFVCRAAAASGASGEIGEASPWLKRCR